MLHPRWNGVGYSIGVREVPIFIRYVISAVHFLQCAALYIRYRMHVVTNIFLSVLCIELYVSVIQWWFPHVCGRMWSKNIGCLSVHVVSYLVVLFGNPVGSLTRSTGHRAWSWNTVITSSSITTNHRTVRIIVCHWSSLFTLYLVGTAWLWSLWWYRVTRGFGVCYFFVLY